MHVLHSMQQMHSALCSIISKAAAEVDITLQMQDVGSSVNANPHAQWVMTGVLAQTGVNR